MGFQWLAIVGVMMVIAWLSFADEPFPVITGELEARQWNAEYRPAPLAPDTQALSLTDEPLQADFGRDAPVVRWDRGRMQLRAQYAVEGRVLGTRRYRNDKEAEVSGLDVALGWGRMADPETIAAFDIEQRDRFYFWKSDRLPIPRREVETSSANKHMIAANPEVERVLMSLSEGQAVRLAGYLVDVEWDDGYRWRTSRTRDDTGRGACEIVWVHRVEVL